MIKSIKRGITKAKYSISNNISDLRYDIDVAILKGIGELVELNELDETKFKKGYELSDSDKTMIRAYLNGLFRKPYIKNVMKYMYKNDIDFIYTGEDSQKLIEKMVMFTEEEELIECLNNYFDNISPDETHKKEEFNSPNTKTDKKEEAKNIGKEDDSNFNKDLEIKETNLLPLSISQNEVWNDKVK